MNHSELLQYDNLVRWVVSKLGISGNIDDSDEYSDGWVGLIRAAHKYDPNRVSPKTGKPVQFQSYAVWWIRAIITSKRKLRLSFSRGGEGHKRKQDRKRTVSIHAADWMHDPTDYRKGGCDLQTAEDAAGLLKHLSGTRRQAVELVVMGGRPIREVGELLGVSHTRVRQLVDTSLSYLRRLMAVRDNQLPRYA